MTLRRLFSALLVGLVCLSCTNDESTAQAENIQLVKEVHLLINRHEWKELEKLFADSVSLKGATSGSQIIRQSKQRYINNCRKMHQTFPQLTQHITQLYAAGTHHVIVETMAEGMTTDSILLSRSSCTIFTIENQKISRKYTYYSNRR
ncbi:nuclear transport factor 2 family protein [Runella limosa]|uniref:nuclear transport factor 2 family protein n=1 Tax=Runella limosa TaxID=370978 RepID=UPI000A07537C|nr:nuclear transport factor 2 family protein [Runella limosa]